MAPREINITATDLLYQPGKTWDEKLLNQAFLVATFSKDPSSKVGAVIADYNHRVVSQGYNGFPRGIEDTPERLADREYKYPHVVHAEVNAILNAQLPVNGFTMYLVNLPCLNCSLHIIQAGIERVVAPEYGTFSGRPDWAASIEDALATLEEADVIVQTVDYDWEARGWRRG